MRRLIYVALNLRLAFLLFVVVRVVSVLSPPSYDDSIRRRLGYDTGQEQGRKE